MPHRDIPLRPTSLDESNRFSRAVCVTFAIYAIVGGILAVAGWVFDIQRLTDWNNEGISMFANTGVGVVLAGRALLLRPQPGGISGRRQAARAFALVAALVGGLTLLEHLTGQDFGIDTLIANRPWGQRASVAPMRMGLPASTSLTALGLGIVLASAGQHARKIACMLALFVMAITSLSLIGYWYQADQLYLLPRYTGIAWQTSTIVAGLAIALTAAVPEFGLVSILRRNDAGGQIARRLLIPIIGIPLLLGWIRILGQDAGYYDTAFGTAVRTLIEIILLTGLLWWTADGISRQATIARAAQNAAKEADRRKDEFLATLAHELRNPLAPIGSALELIKHSGDNQATLQTARDTMERQFGQMVRLVDDLLDIGRITRDKLELRPQRVELASIIHQAVEISRPLAEDSGHKLRVSLPAEHIWIQGDPVRLSQVFSNLLNNACKFTDPGGQITIAIDRDGDEATITVSDTGIGIAPDQLDHIFDMFSQVDQRLERSRSGLGIGLTLVKRLVQLHDGDVEAHSSGLGQGSTFIVRLPVPATEPTPKIAPSPSGTTTMSPKRILITDDNQDAANSMAMLLRLGGHEVETAYDGPEAVQKAQAYQPEIMLLDIGLPGMNGYDVCRSIRKQPWGKSIRIVALTGWGQEQDRRNAREAGFDEHLVKPVDPQTLRRTIASISA